MRTGVRIMLTIAAVLIICVLVLVVGLLALSPGRPPVFLDEKGQPLAGSISERIRVRINGVEQGMFITGKDRRKPVLLFLHGGPGMPEYALSQGYPTVLEDLFVVCWWDQRGAGSSFGANIPRDTLTARQLVSDTIAVTNYLRGRFQQDKIHLMGHSWGSLIGIQAAAQAPELYAAYIGMGQISRQMESEKLAYDYILQQYVAAGNTRMADKLRNAPITGTESLPPAYRALRDEAMHDLGVGTTHAMKSVERGVFVPILLSSVYTLGEKINLWRGKWADYSTRMFDEMLATDLTVSVPKLDVPVYFFEGIYDYTVSYALAKDYFARLRAPQKGFYTFVESAHSPLFEEPDKVRRILAEDVLNGRDDLADTK